MGKIYSKDKNKRDEGGVEEEERKQKK